MKTLLAVCVSLLCVSAAYSQTCDMVTWGWHYGDPFTLGWYNGKYYANCRAWQPTSSKCTGNCGDSWTQLDNDPWGGYSHFCGCCRAHVSLVVTPRFVWCTQIWVFQNECFVPMPFGGWAANPTIPIFHPGVLQHPYYTVGQCDCGPCNPFGGRRKRDVVSFGSLRRIPGEEPADAPRPPTPDAAAPATAAETREAARQAGIRVSEECLERPPAGRG